MKVIESPSNPRIVRAKKIGKKYNENLFLIEGKKLLQEAASAGIFFEEIFVIPEVWPNNQIFLKALERQGTNVSLVTLNLLKSISDVESPQGVLGIARKPVHVKPPTIAKFALLLISIRDPGNFGAILRTAEASGCEWIAHSSDCVDPFLPKVVRASMGSLFRVPLIEKKDPNFFLKQELPSEVQTCGLIPRNGRSLLEWRPEFPLVVCIGSETRGLPENLPLTEKLSIPMKGKVESLNAAVAAAICLYRISSFAEM